MKKLLFYLVFLFFVKVECLDAQTAYFIVNTKACGLCAVNSINIYKSQLKEFDIKIVLEKEDISLVDFVQERTSLDSVIINSSSSFKEIKILSLNDLMIFNNKDEFLCHIPNFTKYQGKVDITKKIKKKDLMLKNIGFFSILHPKVDNDIITTIDPRRGDVLLLKIFNDEFIELYDEYSISKEDKFYYYPSEGKTRQQLWEDLYKGYPDLIKMYSIIKSHSDSLYTISRIFHHFDIDTIENEASAIYKTALLKKYKNKSTKVSLLGFDNEYSLEMLQPISNILNDSLSILNLTNKMSKYHNLAVINSINNNVIILDTLNKFIYSKNVFYSAYSNEIIVYNIDSNEVRKYSYNDRKISALNSKSNFLNNSWNKDIFDFLIHENEIFIIYSDVNKTNNLYLERYNLEDFSFIEGHSLDFDLANVDEMIFAGVSLSKLYLFNKDVKGVWNLSSFKIY